MCIRDRPTAEFSGPFDDAVPLQHFDGCGRGNGGEGIAAVGRGVEQRVLVEHFVDLGRCQCRRDRNNPAAEHLPRRQNVRTHAFLVTPPPGSEAAESGLDLVHDEQRAELRAQFSDFPQVAPGRHPYPALGLHRFQEYARSRRIASQNGLQGVGITERDELHTG